MAQFNLAVPNSNIINRFGEFTDEMSDKLFSKKIASINNQYGDIINQVSENSNVPKELIVSMIIALSNGENNNIFRSVDKLNRSGLFSLSNKTAKQILAREMAQGRMSQKEIDFLASGEPKIASYLSNDKGKKSFNYHWSADSNLGLDRISDTINSFNLKNPKVSIGIGAIWLGQLWDKFSEQTKNPIDKVIVTALLPYDDSGWLSGSSFVKNKSWDIDYTSPEYIGKLPAPAFKTAPSNVINPNKGWVGEALRDILNKNGILYNLTK
jgi:hypothetical protein